MKKILTFAAAAVMAVLVGCKSVPSPEDMSTTSYAVGVAAAFVANQTKIDDTARNEVIAIISEVESCIPQTNETFETAWMPVAKRHVQKLIDDKKIDEGQGTLIIGACDVACKGIDYLVYIRFPKAHEYAELVEAAAHGFCDGFLSNFKPVNMLSAGSKFAADAEALEYLQNYKKTGSK